MARQGRRTVADNVATTGLDGVVWSVQIQAVLAHFQSLAITA